MMLAGLLGLTSAVGAEPESLSGGSYRLSHGITVFGYLYQPTCELSTSRVESAKLHNGSGPLLGSNTLAFTPFSSNRWKKVTPHGLLEDVVVNLVLDRCTTRNITLSLQRAGSAEEAAQDGGLETGLRGAFQYDGQTPTGENGQATSREGVAMSQYSTRWLYYALAAEDARVVGSRYSLTNLPLKKGQAMQCSATYCYLRLDGSAYEFTRDYLNSRKTESGWQDAQHPAGNQRTDLSENETDYFPDNLIEQGKVIIPLHVQIFRGTESDNNAATSELPRGYFSGVVTLTLTVQ